MRRGRWVFHPDIGYGLGSAWNLKDSGWWLHRRTGVKDHFRWCGYCYMPPYRWWMLYRADPVDWIMNPRPYVIPPRPLVPREQQLLRYGQCTHRHRLSEATTMVETYYAIKIMDSLAAL